MGYRTNPEENPRNDSAPLVRTYDGSADVNLVTAGERASRWIVVPASASGTVVYTGLDGVNVTLPAMSQDWTWFVQATDILATSTATSIVVHW